MKRIINFFKTIGIVLKYRERLYCDALTGVYSRLFLVEWSKKEIERAKRYRRPLTLVLVDVDKLKEINTKKGHLEGDRALKKIADILKKSCRQSDFVFRYGGDEFLILMPETSKSEAKNFITRVSQQLRNSKLGVSFGIASWKKDFSIEDLIDGADKKMYKSKKIKKSK